MKQEGRGNKEEGRGGEGNRERVGELPITNSPLPIPNSQLLKMPYFYHV
ncbi:MAG: hypothetical protein HC849_29355 [Oscillatoriales cyanobacterium RU_3_3]|nr:hypothetical protein [Oscillatoriales cyanobacterium RU_3_3]